MSFGYTAGGWRVSDFYRPTIQEYSDEIKAPKNEKENPANRAPIKYGWEFAIVKGAVVLEPCADDYSFLMKAFGYVAHIHECSSDDTASAFQLSVVLKLPFKYGEKAAEHRFSWAFARTNAFSAKAKITKGGFGEGHFILTICLLYYPCFSGGFEAVSIGDAVTGVIKVTKGDYKTAHLSSWRPVSFTEWWHASPQSFFENGVQLPTDAIYHLPSLGFRHLPTNNGFYSQLIFFARQKTSSSM